MKHRKLLWATLVVLAPLLLLMFVLGLWGFMALTATPIHPNPRDIGSIATAPPAPPFAAAVAEGRQVIRTALATQNLPGLSIAVGIGDDLVWAEGFGWADLENRVPVAPETRFPIGSASKALTSAAVGLLLEDGRLKLEDEIQTYLPTFPRKPWPITLRELLAHQAGIRPDEGDEEPLLRDHCDRTADGLRRFAANPLLFEPGTAYRYTSYGSILVSAAIEAAAREPFPAFMRHRVFEPLGLNDTRAESASEPIPAQAVSYFPRFAADPRYGPQDPEQADYSCFTGSSAFVSTPSDLVRFVSALRRGTLLKPATIQLLQTSQRLVSGQETGYGLGWQIRTVALAGAPTRVIGYDGQLMGGVAMSLMTLPDRDLTVAVLSNISYADTPAIARNIVQAFATPTPGSARK